VIARHPGQVTTPDGTVLAVEVALPDRGGPGPAVLVRTPYGRTARARASQPWLDGGFAVVVVDLRGRGGSGGAFVEGGDQRGDAGATLDWLAGQPWCDGRVVCCGLAYETWAAWEAAATGHPAVAAVVARQPWSPLLASGPFPLEDTLRWHADHGGRESRPGALAGLADRLRPLLLGGPLADLASRWPVELPGWPPSRRPGPDSLSFVRQVAGAGVPSLHLASWFCASAAASLAQAAEAGAGATLVAGPWVSELTHRLAPLCALGIPPEAVPDTDRLAASWAAAVLEKVAAPPPSRTFLLGSHRWVDVDSAPAAEGAAAESPVQWYGDRRGVLVPAGEPAWAGPSVPLAYDPADPFPSGRHSDDHLGVGRRTGVLAWTSRPLSRPLGWLGRARCCLEVTAPVAGCDVVVTLLHERPRGPRTRLADAAVEVPPGCTSVEVVLPPAAVEVPAGHRLRLEVTAARFPRFARALPGADRWAAATAPRAKLAVAPSPRGLLHLPATTWPPDDRGLDAEAADPGLAAAPTPLDRLVDERTGVVTSVRRVPTPLGAPPWLHLYAGAVADVAAHLPWPADRVSTGMAVGDRARARVSAVGEAIERYCGNFVPAGLRLASFDKLAAGGEEAVDPRSLALYSPSQYETPGFPFEPFTTGLDVRWARGRWLGSDKPVLVPASLVYVNYHAIGNGGEPATHFVNLAGLAAGPDRQAAERAAMEELIERDATMIWWHNGLPARPVDVDHPRLAPWLCPCPEMGPGWARATGVDGSWRYRVVAIPTTLDVAVVGVLVHDEAMAIVGLGVAARPRPVEAVHKALAEAASLHLYSAGLLDPDGDIWRSARAGVFEGSVLKPWRADRRYCDSYRHDWRDVVDLACHSQVWLDPRMAPALEPVVGDAAPVPLDALPHVRGDVRAGYLTRLLDRGLRPCAVDVTTPDVAVTGARVVRVVAPGAYSNPPAAFPFLGGRRIYDDPVRLGLRAAPAADGELVLAPLPHT
jgi:ribosomal protein S12 methylthiotransferase accessory factor